MMLRQYRDMVALGAASMNEAGNNKLVRVEYRALSVSNEPNKNAAWTRADQDPNAKCAVVTMDDPATLNSLTPALMVQLHEAILQVTRNADVKIVILTGVANAFCSGGNLEMIANGARAVHEGVEDPNVPGAGTVEPWRWIRQQFGGVARLIANSNAVFVASINGVAAGVGLAFALACDVIIMSESARLVPAFGRLGLVPEVGTSYFLTRRLGYQGALNFFVQGQHVSAQDALRMGLCQQVVPSGDLKKATNEWVTRAAAMPSHALEMTKTLLRSVMDLNFDASLRMEEFAESNCFSTRALPSQAESILRASSPNTKSKI